MTVPSKYRFFFHIEYIWVLPYTPTHTMDILLTLSYSLCNQTENQTWNICVTTMSLRIPITNMCILLYHAVLISNY